MGGWVDLIMGRYITLLLFIGLIFGQDTLKTVLRTPRDFKGHP